MPFDHIQELRRLNNVVKDIKADSEKLVKEHTQWGQKYEEVCKGEEALEAQIREFEGNDMDKKELVNKLKKITEKQEKMGIDWDRIEQEVAVALKKNQEAVNKRDKLFTTVKELEKEGRINKATGCLFADEE
ncbi:hypothetical protein B0J14DRAFT_652808 [Halenospora varia]|nr:hypothetical protein B0J14DRAFT_652808 [Halenospora varia]